MVSLKYEKNGQIGLNSRYPPISMTWISLKPDSARFLRISQPRPPAPLGRNQFMYVMEEF